MRSRHRGDGAARASTARSSSPTTPPRTAAPSSPTAAGARVVREERRGYGSAYLAGFAAARGTYIVMGDADLTYDFSEIPRFVARARGRRRPRDGRPDGQHPAGRDAVAAPLRRQPGPLRLPQPPLPHRRPRRPLRHARAAPRHAPGARPAHARDGVRVRDGDPRRQGAASRSASSRSSTTRAAASRSSTRFRDGWRHLRFLLVHSPTHLFIIPGLRDDGPRRDRDARSSLAQLNLFGRAWDLHARSPARCCIDRRHAGRRARPLRARLRHVLHGRARPVVRPHARALPPRARPAARRRRSLVARSCVAAIIVGQWIDRGFGELVGGAPGGPRRDAHDRRHPGRSSRRSC